MSTMRVAIAGTGGLAWLIAHYIREETSHIAMFLSRNVRCLYIGLQHSRMHGVAICIECKSNCHIEAEGVTLSLTQDPGTCLVSVCSACDWFVGCAEMLQIWDCIQRARSMLTSRQPQARLTSSGYQVAVVDYNNIGSLTYALRGIDTVSAFDCHRLSNCRVFLTYVCAFR